VIVGHSMGGLFSRYFAQRHDPDLTTSTIKLVVDRVRALSRK
jgi:triacylglycerol esterase/lipase EstA (alpha/beta hydrolase family)